MHFTAAPFASSPVKKVMKYFETHHSKSSEKRIAELRKNQSGGLSGASRAHAQPVAYTYIFCPFSLSLLATMPQVIQFIAQTRRGPV